ncbi:DMT family transporter [Phaeovulum sp. W22_SRMD_FR3]|uniref:DMT family transporter n=1 Tax=Phaeovulum sp. W22_SRMD_FR3 TaxID=3240274 RepID=UPI003F994A69
MTVQAAGNRTLAAAAAISGYALIIGFTDNYVRVIAAEMGLWQFHAMRSVMVALILMVAVPLLRLDVTPRAWKRVAARSLVHGTGMLIYFGALAFLPVAQVAAGLYTAPIFVLLISRLVYGHAIGPVRIIAVALGFAGILLVLKPGTGAPIGLASLVPVAAGFFYALGNIATREWCAGESAVTLTAAFFAALGVFGLIGMAILTLFPVAVPEGAAGFVMRGPVWPGATASFWVFVQALGSLIGVGLMVRAYQMAEASRVAVFEYVVMPAAAFWGWMIWSEVPGPYQAMGMGLIVLAGLLIALRRR